MEAIKNYLEYLSQPDTQAGIFLANVVAGVTTLLIIFG